MNYPKFVLAAFFLLISYQLTFAQIGRLPLSPLQKIEQNIGKTDIAIEYSRPSKKGRKIFGALVPYGEYWRTGANRNTTIEFNEDVMIDNQRIKKGKYSIITKPAPREWTFILYDEVTNWDVPEIMDDSKMVCSYIVPVIPLNESIESLSIGIGDFTNYTFDLFVQWDKSRIVIPVSLTTKEKMATIIDDVLSGPSGGDYYSAAVYQLESEKEYRQGLEWINKAIEIREEKVWYDYRVKALLMIELGETENIGQTINIGNELAIKKNSEYGIREFKRINGLIK